MNDMPQVIGEEAVKQSVVKSQYNGLEFQTRPSEGGRDTTTPMLMKTDNGELFRVTKGGGTIGRTSVTVGDAPFIPSKIQGRREPEDEPKVDGRRGPRKTASNVEVVA